MLSRSAMDRLVRAAVLRSPTLPASASFHAAAASGRVAAAAPPHAAVFGRTGGRAVAHRPLGQVAMGRGWGVRTFASEAKDDADDDDEPRDRDEMGDGDQAGQQKHRGPTEEEIRADMTPIEHDPEEIRADMTRIALYPEEIRADMTPVELYPIFSVETKDLIWKLNKDDPETKDLIWKLEKDDPVRNKDDPVVLFSRHSAKRTSKGF
ncbi:hypothetical protein T484DRAFT_1811844 [Baffinella frigidus]|nr:hypothetical protein T484DRAFT_1811844 [Cryptophyta sp. CCMP2293]